MNDINLTQLLRNSSGNYPRKRGRYHSSEVYFINKGEVTPEEWLNPKEKDTKTVLMMWSGTNLHNSLEDLLGKQYCEKKGEIAYKDILLVGKADFFPPDYPDDVWEFKTSDKKMKEAKPWHLVQTMIYCTMFDKKRGMVYQPLQDDNGLYLKHLGTVERNDILVEKELEKLYEFHKRVEILWENSKI